MGIGDSKLSRNPSFLARPVTEKHGHGGNGPDYAFGMSCMQGYRAHMEGLRFFSGFYLFYLFC
jgi:hypothetical protein